MRRIVTRSVSATGPTLTTGSGSAHPTEQESVLEEEQEQPIEEQPTDPDLEPIIRKRPSSTPLDDTREQEGYTVKRLRAEDEEQDALGVQEPVIQTYEPPQDTRPAPDHNPLKRSRDTEEEDAKPNMELDEPRNSKRQALEGQPTQPRRSLLNLDIHLHRTPRTPLHNPSFTPSRLLQSKSLPSIPSPEQSADDSGYYDFVVPVKDEYAESSTTPLRSPPPELDPAQFTFNPFAIAISNATPRSARPSVEGDDYGPAVKSLDQLLDDSGHPPLDVPSVDQQDPTISLPPSPIKPVLPNLKTKPRPSMIPRLVLAPPPPPPAPLLLPPRPQTSMARLSPGKSTFTKFFGASPIKGPSTSAPGPRVKNSLPKFATAKAPPSKLRLSTTLSVEAQASLANLSQALEKLAMPRPRTSMDPHSDEAASGDSSTVLGDSSSSSQDKEEEEQTLEERLEELPERPATSLGIRESEAPPSAKRPTRVTRRNPLGFASLPKVKPKPVPPPKASPPSPQEVEQTPPVSDCLQGCVIFVDVRTDEGSDASAMFIEMLKSLSARIIHRPGTSATHFVWKSGLQSTLSRYSAMDEPKPFLVGIGWVVQCVEKRERVEEKKYLVNVKEAEIVFGAPKRQKSLHVKDRSALTEGLIAPEGTEKANQRRISNPLVSGTTRASPAQAPVPKQMTLASMWGKAKGKAKAYDFVELSEAEEDGRTKVAGPSRKQARTSKLGRTEESGPSGMDVNPKVDDDVRIAPIPLHIKSTSTNLAPKPPPIDAKPALLPPPPKLFAKPAKPVAPQSAPVKTSGLEALDSLLSETKTSLLAEANEQIKRKNLLFAPKVSSPLKRNFTSTDEKDPDA